MAVEVTLLEGIPCAELENKRSEHDKGVHWDNWGSFLVPDKKGYLRFASKDGSDS